MLLSAYCEADARAGAGRPCDKTRCRAWPGGSEFGQEGIPTRKRVNLPVTDRQGVNSDLLTHHPEIFILKYF